MELGLATPYHGSVYWGVTYLAVCAAASWSRPSIPPGSVEAVDGYRKVGV